MMAEMLSPPSAKKSSSAPARASFKTFAINSHSKASRAFSGTPPALAMCGAGKRLRSILPLTLRGNSSSTISAAGTI